MKRWVVALVAAVAAFALAVPITVMLITAQPSCGSAVDAIGAAGQQSSSGDEAGVWQALRAAGFDDVHAASWDAQRRPDHRPRQVGRKARLARAQLQGGLRGRVSIRHTSPATPR